MRVLRNVSVVSHCPAQNSANNARPSRFLLTLMSKVPHGESARNGIFMKINLRKFASHARDHEF